MIATVGVHGAHKTFCTLTRNIPVWANMAPEKSYGLEMHPLRHNFDVFIHFFVPNQSLNFNKVIVSEILIT
jgi:hypothetical protein